jgi:hypothetical protein
MPLKKAAQGENKKGEKTRKDDGTTYKTFFTSLLL